MPHTQYHGLPEFGLRLIPPDAPQFGELVQEIREQHVGHWPADELTNAAVLVNQSRRAIATLAYLWRYTTGQGATHVSHIDNLGSSAQLDLLTGRAGVVPDLGSFILPGSKRLLTEQGMFGSNLDVLPPQSPGRMGGYVGSGGGARWRGQSGEELSALELVLDFALLEDGLCLGPDQSGLFQSLTADLQLLHATSVEIAEALRGGASPGKVFEILLPLASARRVVAASGDGGATAPPSRFLQMFANMAIHQLIHTPDSAMRAWFEQHAAAEPLRLHRAV